MHLRARMILGLLAILPLAACEAPPAAVGPTAVRVEIPDREAFIDSTLTRLREMDFPPARVDRLAGRIESRPTTSGQWFEFWRVDSRGSYQTLESSLHTIRRIVLVRLEPADPPTTTQPVESGTFRLSVEVQKERYNAPQRQVTTASGALAIYSERLPTEEGLRGAASRGEQWVPLGRDLLLEEFVLEQILARAPHGQVETVSDEPMVEVELE